MEEVGLESLKWLGFLTHILFLTEIVIIVLLVYLIVILSKYKAAHEITLLSMREVLEALAVIRLWFERFKEKGTPRVGVMVNPPRQSGDKKQTRRSSRRRRPQHSGGPDRQIVRASDIKKGEGE